MSKATTTTTTTSLEPSSAYTNMCFDGHACDNDASCVESLLHENKYVCDCHDAYLQTGRVYTGLSCQHVATEYCTESGEISPTSFCANQGSCKSKLSDVAAAHPGCDCPKSYDGEHCQYITNSVPSELSYFLDGTTFSARMRFNTEGSGVKPATIVVPILVFAFAALGFVLYKYRGLNLLGMSRYVVDKNKMADENMLDADGTNTLGNNHNINIMASQRRNSTPAFSSTHNVALMMDPPDFDDLLEQSDHVKFHMDPTGTAAHKLFASDPGLQYAPTTETTGSGSPTNYGVDNLDDDDQYGLGSGGAGFEDYDIQDFSPSKSSDEDDVAAYDPTFT